MDLAVLLPGITDFKVQHITDTERIYHNDKMLNPSGSLNNLKLVHI